MLLGNVLNWIILFNLIFCNIGFGNDNFRYSGWLVIDLLLKHLNFKIYCLKIIFFLNWLLSGKRLASEDLFENVVPVYEKQNMLHFLNSFSHFGCQWSYLFTLLFGCNGMFSSSFQLPICYLPVHTGNCSLLESVAPG